MNINYYKNTSFLDLETIVEELKNILEIYKNFGSTSIAKIFDEKFKTACAEYKISRTDLFKKIINN